MKHNAGAHSHRVENPSKWTIIISTLIITGVLFTAVMIAIFVE